LDERLAAEQLTKIDVHRLKDLAIDSPGGGTMNKLFSMAMVIVAAGLMAQPWAQDSANKPAAALTLSPSHAVLEAWHDIGRKLIVMAEDFPEDKYEFKPNPAQRSFADQLLHVAGSNDLFTDVANGRKPVDDESHDHYKTKAAIVAYLKNPLPTAPRQSKRKGTRTWRKSC